MTFPRRLLPQQTHAVSRRCSGRRFLLRPDPFTNDVVRYAFARAKQLCPTVSLHAVVAESNHTHTGLTDARKDSTQRSSVSDFFRNANRLIAAALNTRYGRGENLWAPGSFHNTEVHGQLSLEQQLLYLWTNPVKDGLVERPEDWPGVLFLPEDFGLTYLIPKPDGAFFGGRRPREIDEPDPLEQARGWQAELAREEAVARQLLRGSRGGKRRRPRDRSALPEAIELTIDPPPGYEHMTLPEVRRHFRRLLDAEVERIHAARRAEGKTQFMGAKRVLEQDPFSSAGETWPSFATQPRSSSRSTRLRATST